MRNPIKMLSVAGLMTASFAHAAVPADFNATPGVLFVKWHSSATQDSKTNAMLEIRDESGDLLTSVRAKPVGTQQVKIPNRTQGNLTISLAGENSEYRLPFGIGDGNAR